MNQLTTPRIPARIRFTRACVFWLLAVEGAALGALFFAGICYGLVTRDASLAQLWQHNPVFLIGLGVLTLASLWTTARQVSRHAWNRLPRTLLVQVIIGGGLLFAQTFLAFPTALVTPYRLLTALTALALALYFAPSSREHSGGGVAASRSQVQEGAGEWVIAGAGTVSRCERCGRPDPPHLVSLEDGSQPSHLCNACFQEVIRPNTAFQPYKPR